MKEVLIVSIGFSPNVGGIETHFDDLTAALDKRNWKTWVLTYKPITTNVSAPVFEQRGKNVSIYRIPWFGGIFYRFIHKPLIEFIYLFPGLFIFLPVFLLFKGRNINVIHSHGLIAGAVSVFWGKIFGKKVITTTHSIYNFPASGFYRNFARWIFSKSDSVLTLSKQSAREVESLGVSENKINVFTYWIDLERFKKIFDAKKKLKWDKNFTVLYVGRLIEEKGILPLIKSFKSWSKKISLVVIGTGPLESIVKKASRGTKNLFFIGKVKNKELPLYYSAADLTIVPSVSEEGFGRVILESLACGTPVIGSNRGAIPEAMNNSVGQLINITPVNIKKSIEFFYNNPDKIAKLAKSARRFATEHYSEKNVNTIIDTYEAKIK